MAMGVVKRRREKDDSSSEEEDSDKEVAMLVRNFEKFINKKSNRRSYGNGKGKPRKRFCYGCG
jgi:hypothetical protein